MTSWADRLRAAAREGTVLDVTGDGPGDPAEADQWDEARTLPASELRGVLIDPDLKADPRGLHVVGARITGELDLSNGTLTCALALTRCAFETRPNLQSAALPRLSLDGSHLPGLLADGLHVTYQVSCKALTCEGDFRALGIHVGGQFNLGGATLTNPSGRALILDQTTINGGLFANNGFKATGETRAVNAHIGGQLNLDGATLTNPGGRALILDQTTINGGLFAINGFQAVGQVRAPAAHVSGQLNLDGATLTNPGGDALNLDGITINGDLFANNGFQAAGQVRAPGAHISGQLALRGATLTNPGGDALNLDGITINGDLLADDGLTATGQVRAIGAHISGQLGLTNAALDNPDGDALNLDGATIDGDLFAKGLEARGCVSAEALTINGHLRLSGSALTNPGGVALDLTRARITQAVHVKGRIKGKGRIVTTRAAIEGRVAVGAPRGRGLTRRGWRPNWPLVWLGTCWLVAFGVAWFFPNHFRPADQATRSMVFSPVAYATGVAIPTASAVVPGNWTGPWELVVLMSALKVGGWLFAALLLTSYTGLLRRT